MPCSIVFYYFRYSTPYTGGYHNHNHSHNNPKPEFAVPKSAPPQVKLEGSPIIPHHVKLSKAQEEIILQTPFGTFHRFPQPGQPSRAKPSGLGGEDGRDPLSAHTEGTSSKSEGIGQDWCPGKAHNGSPEPLEMDIAPPPNHSDAQMPKLSPAVSPQKEGLNKPVIVERPPGVMDRQCPELYRRPDQMDFADYKVG